MKRVALLAIVVLMAGRIAQASEPLSPIQQAMLRIRDERIEHMIVLNSAGEIIGETSGAANTTSHPGTVSLSNTTVLHNHPQSVQPWFSPEDYLFADMYYVRRMVVVAPVTVNRWRMYLACTFERADGQRWPAIVYNDVVAQMKQKSLHQIWFEHAAQHGLQYECVVLP